MDENEIDLSSSSSCCSSPRSSPIPSPLMPPFAQMNDLNLNADDRGDCDSNLLPNTVPGGGDSDDDEDDKKPIRSKNELTLDDLPPIEKLDIRADEEKLSQLGSIHAFVDKLVIVQSFKNSPPLNIDTVLFLRDCKPLGRIFDVFGKVEEAFYSIRFNTKEDLADRPVEVGSPVYYQPDNETLTSFVFLESLRQIKGSDASWKDDNEPPEDALEYSDDETERRELQKRRLKRKLEKEHKPLMASVDNS